VKYLNDFTYTCVNYFYFPSASHQVILLSTDTEIGQKEVSHLRQQGSIAHEYLLKQDSSTNCTTIQQGYFWVDN